MGVGFDFRSRIRYGDRQSTISHHREIDNVIPDESGFAGMNSLLPQDLFECRQLVLNTLVDVFQPEVTGAQGDSFGNSFGDQPRLNPADTSQRDRRAIVRMEALCFYQRLTHEAKAALSAMLGSVILSRLLDSGRCGKDEELAVGQDPVYVKEKQFDLPGAKFGG